VLWNRKKKPQLTCKFLRTFFNIFYQIIFHYYILIVCFYNEKINLKPWIYEWIAFSVSISHFILGSHGGPFEWGLWCPFEWRLSRPSNGDFGTPFEWGLCCPLRVGTLLPLSNGDFGAPFEWGLWCPFRMETLVLPSIEDLTGAI